MLSATLNNLSRKAIFLPSTEMKETLEKHKKTLEIFRNLKQNEKLGKQKDVSGVMQYYKGLGNTEACLFRDGIMEKEDIKQ